MKIGFALVFVLTPSLLIAQAQRDQPGWSTDHSRYRLPNGWSVSPVGRSVALPGDMPVEIKFSSDGKSAYIVTSGYHDPSLSKIDLSSMSLASTKALDKCWAGLVEAKPGEWWVSAGQAKSEGPSILKVSATDLSSMGDVVSPKGVDRPFVAGMTLGSDGNIYVLNIQTDQILAYDRDGHFLQSTATAYRPFRITEMPDHQTLAVANWGDCSISFYSEFDLQVVGRVSVGPHPAALAAAADGRLFVANAADRTVSCVFDNKVTETIRTGVDLPQNVGSTPLSLALDESSGRLYVADAGDNCITVVDISRPGHSKAVGLIPTDRYPSEIALSPDHKTLLVATAKGLYGPNATDETRAADKTKAVPYTYIGRQLQGKLYAIAIPSGKELADLTHQAVANVLHADAALSADAKSDAMAAIKKIKHVIYVIRENRTFDQEFGDIAQGNGDPNLVMFGAKVTPNGHALANQFTLLDNLYCDGEVSQCGHQWTDSAYANDYTEKQWILSYGDHGEVESDPRLTANQEYIWTLARKHGVSERVYGEYVNLQEDHDHASANFSNRLEQMNFSQEVEDIFAKGGRDPEKVAVLLKEMKAAEQTGKWPALMVIALPEDHTRGFAAGKLTPFAMVGSNDQALGELVEGVSHTSFWSSTAIFVIQDDAQDGPDHVDSHRTVGFLISPYTKRHAVDSTHYTTSSMLRTMEMMLGLPPMTEYDATATPMLGCLQSTADLSAYDLVAPGVDLNKKNPAKGSLAERSKKLRFAQVDENDPDVFNRLLWDGIKTGTPYPMAANSK
jgi:DNA-binding beta-propeller fold protein YncE